MREMTVDTFSLHIISNGQCFMEGTNDLSHGKSLKWVQTGNVNCNFNAQRTKNVKAVQRTCLSLKRKAK
jgi:hypothetical protein